MHKPLVIHWFRQDLRLADNPSLHFAAQQGEVLPLFIRDDHNAGEHRHGSASRWWLHYALSSLNQSLNGQLSVFCGDAESVLLHLIQAHSVAMVCWNRCYEPWRIKRDQRIKTAMTERGIKVKSFNGSLLWEPWQVKKKDGTPYKVFTPFYRKGCLGAEAPRQPLPTPPSMAVKQAISGGMTINDLQLLPNIRWDKQLEPHWEISEDGAHHRLQTFIEYDLADYKEGRNFPSKKSVTRLSPHLHFGQLSPNQVWHAVQNTEGGPNQDHLLSELGWREFSYNLLYHFPELPSTNLQAKFDHFPWQQDASALQCWQRGLTGYPIVDAGMRELWRTGYMHNRIRMVVGSFLVKNLLLHWHQGEAWFWDCLVDADLANNSASWQWIAGCGADAAPYFRIFNPITQGEKFDPAGEYTRRWVPELNRLPDKYLFKPWTAPEAVLQQAEVKLGDNYPFPIVDIKTSRERALAAFQSLKDLHTP